MAEINVADVVATFSVDHSKFDRGISAAESRLGSFAGSAQSTAARVSGSLSRVGDAVKGIAVVAGGGLAVLGGFGVKAAADAQQTRIAFEGVLGSATKANAFIGQLRAFAAKTPFEFPELAKASQQLLGVGFAAEQVIPTMTKIGNVASALGVGADGVNRVVIALGQIRGKGRTSAEELQQISEAIPGFSAIDAIAKQLGITTAEAFKKLETGAIDADTGITAILAGMERFPGAAGAMDRQSRTLNGVISTLKDTFRNALIDGIEPLLPALSSGLTAAMPKVQAAVSGIANFTSNAVKQLGYLVDLFRSGDADAQGFAEILDNVFGNTGRLVPAFRLLYRAGADVVAGFKAVAGFVKENMTPVLVGLGVVAGALVAAQVVTLGAAVLALVNPFTVAVAALAALAAGVVYAYEHFEGFRNAVDATGRFLTGTALPAVQAFASGVAQVIGSVVGYVQQVWPQISEAIGHVMASVSAVTSAVLGAVQAVWHAVGDDVLNYVGAVFKAIGGVVDGAMQVVRGVVQTVLALINGDWGKAWDGLKGIVSGVFTAIRALVVGQLETLRALLGGIVSIVSGLADGVFRAAVDIGKKIVDGIVKGIKAAPGALIKAIESLIPGGGVIGGAIEKVGGAFGDAAGAVSKVIPHFDTGGIVPGPIGVPRLAVVHAGETVIPTHRSSFGLIPSGPVDQSTHIAVHVANTRSDAQEIAEAIAMKQRVARLINSNTF